ncbi:NUDIX hydrolase domain-like protein [Yarrowia lipolytica]|jgi:8-oxo-dGTP pyrophosphatase MutT (NUDIX family)|uniref:YALI0E12397p n=2 Tax=Yarrowia lipolytica TaxID=4952 RepID=Q6C651_YARLI|nr:YALI0E12397p [Yarrowia lipolytica CLIB122]AOW05323.1 hypothetical protein YALI1_E15321g [Yarrowia lipolytica]KAB8283782.1 NUDIX hydrolase domain-like protein [Yarrowia lipolytica]KAE8172707.1 NUDIX hydrolase domain-like protein [Yarrowia lipolytica]KAJ8056841.1 NUDIX hydrolase domain-like protein [Yarrowia lipolytica]QNP98936.1 Hypothetical protein YALI2_E00252g [Yarrowia lipolytica]|eukprot:XP_503861.1 YALI0E12397p [Yarrowia lipolytica CLIB122]
MSLLEIIKKCDSAPYTPLTDYYIFTAHEGTPLGYLTPLVVAELKKETDTVSVDDHKKTVTILAQLDTSEKRSEAFEKLGDKWRAQKLFDVLEGWRNEKYAIYNPTGTVYFLMERAVTALFGVVTYGVHIVGFVPGKTAKDARIWVPKRALTKPTWPGYLDNTVAGGVGYPASLWETAVKECGEEAGLEPSYVEPRLSSTGVVSYLYRATDDLSDELSVIQPEVEYVMDLEMDEATIPAPADGEVESFELLSVDRVLTLIKEGKFKPNTALITIDFLIRRGVIGVEQPGYVDILCHSHRKLPFPLLK